MKSKEMQTLWEICDDILSGNNRVFGKKLPLASMQMVVNAYNELVLSGKTVTIYRDIKDVLEKCGFVAIPEGIGWIFQK